MVFVGQNYFKSDGDVNTNVQDKVDLPKENTETISQKDNPALPRKLLIPKLKISAEVESVAMDSQGRMDVPKEVMNAAWYNLGYKPGDQGSAVISGHLDTSTGAPAVFYDLNKLAVGDEITTIDTEGKEFTFSVYDIKNYPYDKLPLKEIFASVGESQLNLITCAGNWDSSEKNYSTRTVVYSRLKQ